MEASASCKHAEGSAGAAEKLPDAGRAARIEEKPRARPRLGEVAELPRRAALQDASPLGARGGGAVHGRKLQVDEVLGREFLLDAKLLEPVDDVAAAHLLVDVDDDLPAPEHRHDERRERDPGLAEVGRAEDGVVGSLHEEALDQHLRLGVVVPRGREVDDVEQRELGVGVLGTVEAQVRLHDGMVERKDVRLAEQGRVQVGVGEQVTGRSASARCAHESIPLGAVAPVPLDAFELLRRQCRIRCRRCYSAIG